MAKKKGKSEDHGGDPRTPRVSNRRAFHDYHILEKVECGLELRGTEVKSLRAGSATLDGAYAAIRDGQVYLCGATIAVYPQATGVLQHDPMRDRKLLLHAGQIHKLQVHTSQKGHTLVPLALYFKKGWAKCEIGAAMGKRAYDKRQAIRTRQQKRDVDRELKRR